VVNDLNLLNGGQINSISTAGIGAGGNIDITAGSIRLDGGGLMDQTFTPLTQISTATGDLLLGGGSGKGGDISIHTCDLELFNSAQISSASFGAGNAGKIDITASSVSLDAQLSTVVQISANSQHNPGGGNAGDISISTDTLTMQNGALIVATSFGDGQAGKIGISAQSIDLLSGSIISAGTFGSGNGGDIQITADSLHINGQTPLAGGIDFPTGIQAVTTDSASQAPGGNIQINVTGDLEMEHSGSIFTSSIGGGPGGNITIHAGDVSLTRDSTITASGEETGPAGKVSVTSDNDVLLTHGSAISTSALQSSGGDISVTAGHQIKVKHSQISAQAGPGGGGNIALDAPSKIYLLDGTITAQAEGDGGNLSITGPDFFIMNRGGLISKSSTANGGNITILSRYFFQSESTIDASAPFGLPGTVTVSAPEIDLSGSLIALPQNLLDAEAQLRPDCAVRLAGDVSTFILLGRGGLPLEPGGFVPSETGSPLNERK
jgi:large exoprotein involved in heme utilization and adhesion